MGIGAAEIGNGAAEIENGAAEIGFGTGGWVNRCR